MGIPEEAVHGFLFGALVGLLAHHGIVWWRTRQRSWPLCLGAFACLGVGFAGHLMLLSDDGGPLPGPIARAVGGLSLLTGCALLLRFTHEFRDSAQAPSMIDRLAQACLWVSLLDALALALLVVIPGGPADASLLATVGVGASVLALVVLAQAMADRGRQDLLAREERRCSLALAQASRRAQDEQSRLLAGVANNLRQPLYAATLATESLRRDPSRLRAGRALDRLHEALETADGMLDSALTVAQLEAGTVRPGRQPLSLDTLLDRVDRTFGPKARAKGLRWTVTPCLATVTSDAQMLQRIVFQLVGNAVDYTESGGVLVSCRVRRAGVLLQVWDTGGGLPPEPDAQVFERHFRGETGTETESGVGFGLVIAKRAALLLGLVLSVRSRRRHGSCFSLWLPDPRCSTGEDAGVGVQEVQRLSASGAVVLDALQHERAAMSRH